MLPDLESLRCFVQAATQLNFRVAARNVALSPAAFGDRIRRLEDQFGSALFARTTRKVALTPQGERLLPQARRCLDEAERCALTVASDVLAPFEIVIGTRWELGVSWVVPALGRLERNRPERRLHVYFGDTMDVLPRLLRGEVHCMITSARLTTGGLGVARVQEEEYAFVAARTLLAKKPLRGPDDAKRHTLLDIHADLPLFRYLLDARSADELWAFERVQYLGGIAGVRSRALEGAGVAVLPLYYVRRDLAQGKLKRLLPATKLPSDWFRLVWRSGQPREAEFTELAGELSQIALR